MVSTNIGELLVDTHMQEDMDQLFAALPGPATMTDLVIGAQRHAPVREKQSIFKTTLLTLISSFVVFAFLTVTCCFSIGVRAKHLRRSNMEKMIFKLKQMTSEPLLPISTEGEDADQQDAVAQSDGSDPERRVVMPRRQ